MSGKSEETNDGKKLGIKPWHIIVAAAVLISGFLVAASGVKAGFIAAVIALTCALHILFPAAMVERYLKSAVRSNNTIANIVRIGAITITVLVDIIFLIQ